MLLLIDVIDFTNCRCTDFDKFLYPCIAFLANVGSFNFFEKSVSKSVIILVWDLLSSFNAAISSAVSFNAFFPASKAVATLSPNLDNAALDSFIADPPDTPGSAANAVRIPALYKSPLNKNNPALAKSIADEAAQPNTGIASSVVDAKSNQSLKLETVPNPREPNIP